jgi:hypothetical protein
MKEIDIGDEVKVKNQNGVFIVETYTNSYSYYYGSENSVSQYRLKAKDSAKTIFVYPHEILPMKSLKQKIDEMLDTYNDLMEAYESTKDEYYKQQADLTMKYLRKV